MYRALEFLMVAALIDPVWAERNRMHFWGHSMLVQLHYFAVALGIVVADGELDIVETRGGVTNHLKQEWAPHKGSQFSFVCCCERWCRGYCMG